MQTAGLFFSAHVLYFLIHEKNFVRFSFVISKNERSWQLNMHYAADKNAYLDLYSVKPAYHTWFCVYSGFIFCPGNDEKCSYDGFGSGKQDRFFRRDASIQLLKKFLNDPEKNVT